VTRIGPPTFAVFDVFTDATKREAHFAANAGPLLSKAAELFTRTPQIEYLDVVSALLPGEARGG
jgi:hypothetical protein